MTYLENKKMLFSLIDEKNPNNQYFTDDEDARIKCANLYAGRYLELASYRPPKKLKEYTITEIGEGYERFKLPKAQKRKTITGLNENNEKVPVDYYELGDFIYISKKKKYTVVVEYEPFLTLITDETPDDFELEIDDDLAGILPLGVASDLFKTDPGEDWTAFEKEYYRRLEQISTSRNSISATVTEGEL